jgi:phosphoglycerate dehydrogenase-like enzyme
MIHPIEILITLNFEPSLVNILRSVSSRLSITVFPARSPEEIPAELWSKVEVLYTNRALPDTNQAPNLRWIQFHLAGIDNLIGAPILRKPDLIVTTLSGAAVPQMVEYLLMALLVLGHHFPDIIGCQRLAEWPRDRWKRFSPKELSTSTVGIVGYGSVGRSLARILKPFGTTILAVKRDAKHPEDIDYIPEGMGDPEGILIRRLYPWQALRSMFKECDFVVICAPLTPETYHLISTAEFEAMKPESYLIDVSRGGVVDHEALLIALNEGKLRGVFLDVFPEEPLPPESPLWQMPNVIITPHIAGNSPMYNERAVKLFSENLHRYLGDLPVFNRFDFERGY